MSTVVDISPLRMGRTRRLLLSIKIVSVAACVWFSVAARTLPAAESPLEELVSSLLVLMDRTAPPEQRGEAARQMGRLGDTRAIVPLLYALADPEPRVQLAVVQALGFFTTPEVEQALTSVLLDSGRMTSIRAAAAHALGAQHTETARNSLYQVYRDSAQPRDLREACGNTLDTFFPGYLASLGDSGRVLDRAGRVLLVPASAAFGAYTLGTIGQFGRSDAAVPIGVVSGMVLGGAASYLLTQDEEMTTSQAGSIVTAGAWGLWTGLTAGRMATYDRPDTEFVTLMGLVGQSVGLGAAVWSLHRNPFSFQDIVAINLGTLAGHNAVWGGLLLAQIPSDTPASLGMIMAGSLGSMAGSAALARKLHFSPGDMALVAHGAVQGAWAGMWLPLLGEERATSNQMWGGLLLGSSVGLVGAAVISQDVELSVQDTLFMATGSGYGYVLGAGLPLLFGAERRQPVLTSMLGGGLVGLAAAAGIRDQLVHGPGDTALTVLGTAWGAWQGASLGAYLYSRQGSHFEDLQVVGATLTGLTLGGVGALAVAQSAEVSSWEVLMMASGGMWGSWFSLWGNLLADTRFGTIWLSNLLASNAGLALAALLMSPMGEVHPTRVGIADLAGMSGAALASLGAALATDDPNKIITANLVGSGLGLVVGAGIASKVPVASRVGPGGPGMRGWQRLERVVSRWRFRLSVAPWIPSEGGVEGRGWYVNLSGKRVASRGG